MTSRVAGIIGGRMLYVFARTGKSLRLPNLAIGTLFVERILDE